MVAATDGSSNTVTNNHQLSVSAPALSTSCYDTNGNLVSDGTNTYLWDAENRLVQINYQGVNNYSQFTHDPYGRIAKIVETVGGTVTSTKQFVWTDDEMKETRDSSGGLIAQYFDYGQTISGASYFYIKDGPPESIRELTDTSGTIQALYGYDSYGRVTKLGGSLSADFQYGGYYFHAPSALSLPVRRAYSASVGRWINRDPASERGGLNLYAYVKNAPVGHVDPLGLACAGCATATVATTINLMPAVPNPGPPPPTGNQRRGYCRSLACCWRETLKCFDRCYEMSLEIEDPVQRTCWENWCRGCCLGKYQYCISTVSLGFRFYVYPFDDCPEEGDPNEPPGRRK